VGTSPVVGSEDELEGTGTFPSGRDVRLASWLNIACRDPSFMVSACCIVVAMATATSVEKFLLSASISFDIVIRESAISFRESDISFFSSRSSLESSSCLSWSLVRDLSFSISRELAIRSAKPDIIDDMFMKNFVVSRGSFSFAFLRLARREPATVVPGALDLWEVASVAAPYSDESGVSAETPGSLFAVRVSRDSGGDATVGVAGWLSPRLFSRDSLGDVATGAVDVLATGGLVSDSETWRVSGSALSGGRSR